MARYCGFNLASSRRRTSSSASTSSQLADQLAARRGSLQARRNTQEAIAELRIDDLNPAKPAGDDTKTAEATLPARSASLESRESDPGPSRRAFRARASPRRDPAAQQPDLTEVYELAKTFCNEFERLQQPGLHSPPRQPLADAAVSRRSSVFDVDASLPGSHRQFGLVPHPPTAGERCTPRNEMRARWVRQAGDASLENVPPQLPSTPRSTASESAAHSPGRTSLSFSFADQNRQPNLFRARSMTSAKKAPSSRSASFSAPRA